MPSDWIDRLNGEPGRVAFGGGRVDLLHWAYDPALVDNQPHRHTYFEACLVGDHGSGHFIESGREHLLTPGTFFLARPGVVHQILNAEPRLMELFWVCFAWSEEPGPARTEGERLMRAFASSDVVIARDEGDRLRKTWEALRALAPAALPDQLRALVEVLLLTIGQTLVPTEPQLRTHDPAVQLARQAVRYIEDNLNRPLTVEEIAAHVHVSPRHLTRLVVAYTGVAPARYATQARLDRASAMLRGTDLSIKEIADAVGFEDVAYFTRCFGRWRGVTPAAYRRGERSGRIVQSSGGLV